MTLHSLQGILLAGCTSSGPLTGVYILGMNYDPAAEPSLDRGNATAATLALRIGYFAVCAKTQAADWACGTDLAELASNVTDPWNLYGIATHYRSQVVFSPLMSVPGAPQAHQDAPTLTLLSP